MKIEGRFLTSMFPVRKFVESTSLYRLFVLQLKLLKVPRATCYLFGEDHSLCTDEQLNWAFGSFNESL
jgi:hypothetical protein